MARVRPWAAIWLILLVCIHPAPSRAKSRSRNGAVQINSSVPGAAVRIDGNDAGTTPLRSSISVRAGTHLVEIAKRGVGTMSQKVTVSAGSTVTVQVRLDQDEPVPLLALEPLPAAPIEPELALVPPPAPPLTPPISAPGSMQLPTVVSLPPAATSQDVPPLDTQATLEAGPAWYEHWWVWAAAGVVVAGAGVLTYQLVKPKADLVIQAKPASAPGAAAFQF